jgi:hypothetical protein
VRTRVAARDETLAEEQIRMQLPHGDEDDGENDREVETTRGGVVLFQPLANQWPDL